jgi:DNA-binding LacI/PurR family transcriptional regulator
VRIDNTAGGRLAAEHFAQRGHRRVAYLMGNPVHKYSREMLAGFRARGKELGLDQDDQFILELPKWAGANGRPFLESLAKIDPRPTALFASETGFAIDMCRVLTGAGMRVPEEFGVLGYELSESNMTHPDVSRIELPTNEIGKQGAALLHQLVREPSLLPTEMRLKPVCVDRGSVRTPAAEGRITF